MSVQAKEVTLYSRLGGYDAIAAVADDLLRRSAVSGNIEGKTVCVERSSY